MIKLYIADVSRLDIKKALGAVSDYRRNKALRCPDEGKMRCCLGVELLLHRALGVTEPLDYSLDANGKPYFENGSVFFSLSHSGNYAVCAVSDCEVGVDIEQPRRNSLKLAKRFFTEGEYELIAESADPDEQFCRIWVIKESYIKATGSGFKTPLESFTAADRIGEYSTAHFKLHGCHIAVCAKCESIGDVELYDEEII